MAFLPAQAMGWMGWVACPVGVGVIGVDGDKAIYEVQVHWVSVDGEKRVGDDILFTLLCQRSR